jgi:peptidoglycan L-alanyl-D-glutamate endopeptidase CwlK
MDNLTLERIKTAHPKLKDELSAIYTKINTVLTGKAVCRFAYVIRTFAEQKEIYAQGRTKLYDASGKRLGIVTKAAPGWSLHNYGLAVDIVLLKDTNGDGKFETASWENTVDFDKDGKADWMEIVEIFKEHGWKWGGDFKELKDTPHFEKSFGYSVKDLLAKYNAKDFISGTTYVNI